MKIAFFGTSSGCPTCARGTSGMGIFPHETIWTISGEGTLRQIFKAKPSP